MDASLSKMMHKKIPGPEAPAILQNFPLPSPILYYITMNPSSSKAYSKMIQTCKYFFQKNPILVAKIISHDRICHNDVMACQKNRSKCCLKFDVSKSLSKIWLLDTLKDVRSNNANFISLLRTKLYRSEAEMMLLVDATVNFNDFTILASTVTSFHVLGVVNIIHDNGKSAMLEEIIGAIPNIINFQYAVTDEVVSASTIKNITKLQNLANLKYFSLFHVPEIFKVEDVLAFFKAFQNASNLINFENGLSEDYENQLDALLDTLIASNMFYSRVYYLGVDREKINILCKVKSNDAAE